MNSQDVAIVGMSGRFPGAADVEGFWSNLCAGVESIGRFSREQVIECGVAPAVLDDPRFVNAGGDLDDIELFDAGFFGFTPREGEIIDPQHRMFLECAWESLENAGHDPYRGDERIGVYAGSGSSSYARQLRAHPELTQLLGHFQLSIGNDKDHLTTLVAYKLNLRGPAVTVQTTCSTSLVAVVMACQGLLTRQCDLALAGGASVVVPQRTGYLYQEGGILSPDGRCRAYDAQAQGAVGGNGVGVVVLRRLSDAVEAGDLIHAVIRGAAINNDGSLKIGYTAPSIDGQAEVIAAAHELAGIDPETIGFVEGHGTGTPLGDPIEVAALTKAFRRRTAARGFCALGSVKTNIGHLDAAAGVAGLIKAALVVERGQLPASLHFTEPNPALELDDSPFYVNDTLRSWQPDAGPRRAGVSSFGIGGTNAHVVLEQPPPPQPSEPGDAYQVLPMSARSTTALDAMTDNLAAHLEHHPELALADVAHTLQVGRAQFAHRRVVAARTTADAASLLRRHPQTRLATAVAPDLAPPVAFLFPGQGAQHAGMAAQVYASEATFREQIDRFAELARGPLGLDFRTLLLADPADGNGAGARLRDTAIAQPALFAVEFALARLWMQWGVVPDALLGHSVGEYVAAALAGVFSAQEGLALVIERGRLMSAQPAGAMVAVAMGESSARELVHDGLSLAAVNGHASCVFSGPEEHVTQLERALAMRGVAATRLLTSHAFHSAAMDAVIEPFTRRVASIALHPPSIPFVSNLHGRWIEPDEATDPAYWGEQLRRTVHFGAGIEDLLADPDRVLLEVGPGRTLTTLARQNPAAAGRWAIPSLPHPQEGKPEGERMAQALGELFLAGVPIDWPAARGHARRRRVPLPTYPFERRRLWVDATTPRAAPAPPGSARVGTPAEWVWVPTWRRTAPAAGRSADHTEGPWLILGDDRLGPSVVEVLTEREQPVVLVSRGSSFRRSGHRSYELAAAAAPGYEELVRDLAERGLHPTRVVHMWSLAEDPPGTGAATSRPGSFYSLLFLIQALAAAGDGSQVDVTAVTAGVYDVTGAELLRPERALLLGPAKVAPQEHPSISCRIVDLAEVPASHDGVREHARRLLGEVGSDQRDRVVAYRGGHRWVQGFERLAPATGEARVRRRGTYLITGGLGSVGGTLARALARVTDVNLALVGRSRLPGREEWESRSNGHGERSRMTEAIGVVQALERQGARVLPLAADVSDPDQLRAALDTVHAEFGPIHGVIHAAGATDGAGFCPIDQMTEAISERHFAAKVDGTAALDAALADDPLDFCMLTSSLSALLGGLGFAAYAAANAYLDAFAAARTRAGAPWMSVNWDGWDFSGRDPAQAREGTGRFALTPTEGATVFSRLISESPLAQVAVSTGDLPARVSQWIALESVRPSAAAPPAHNGASAPPADNVQDGVVTIWRALLGIEQIGPEDNFFELGGHSLLAIQLASRLRTTFHVDVSVHTLFESPTVAELSERISGQLSSAGGADRTLEEILDQVEQLSDEEITALLEAEP
jgi:acyl transferase domain-containing protein